MRERSRSGTYFLGLRRLAFLPTLAWAFALSFGLPALLAATFFACSFFAALRAAFSASVLRWRGTSFAVA